MGDDRDVTGDDLSVRLATIDDQEVVLDLLAQGARYARIRGSDQWPDRFPDELIRSGIGRHEVHVGALDGVVCSTFSLTWADEAFWGIEDDQAGYVHRLVVAAERRGGGLGRRLLDWAQEETSRQGRDLLRLDCLTGNVQLRRWYEVIGFAHQRDRVVRAPAGYALPTVKISLYQRSIG